MALITLQNISISFGSSHLLDSISLQVESQQRICLLGRNGTGKSTLMKIMDKQIQPDSGVVLREKGINVSFFCQGFPETIEGNVVDIIAHGLDNDHHSHDDTWNKAHQVDKIISQMAIDDTWEFSRLSGGQKKRVLLAQALVSDPDLLLLDEPTNHLDIDTITWLESFLIQLKGSIVFVTHDRMFLKKLATRIIEIDRGKLLNWACDYDTFVKRKQEVLNIEEKEWKNFDKKLSQEEAWIRRGIKARRTRNEGRVRALLAMREQRENRRYIQGNANINLGTGEKSGKLVLEARNISHSYQDRILFTDFSTTIMRGDKIGILGPNGCGKTTLVNILIKKLLPKTGTVRHGVNLSILYYDQLREQLDEDKTVRGNVLPNGETVTINGRDKNIFAYLEDFLFTRERMNTTVRYLSGGERNRLLLARLFTQPANFLVLDEPTNDLDTETLEILEDLLVTFDGTLLLICHDRTFINNVVTSTISFNEDNQIIECEGGYDEWIRYKQRKSTDTSPDQVENKKEKYRKEKKSDQKVKLTFNETKELKELPARIQKLENEQQQLYETMADTEIYQDKEKIKKAKERLAAVEKELTASYERWEYLESFEQ